MQTIENDVKNTYLDDWKSISLPNQQDIQREIFLQDIKMGGKMGMTSKGNYAFSRLELVNMINKQVISLSSLGMKSIQDLITMLGDDCAKITNLVIPYNFQNDFTLGEKILIHFPKLTCLSLQTYEGQLIGILILQFSRVLKDLARLI